MGECGCVLACYRLLRITLDRQAAVKQMMRARNDPHLTRGKRSLAVLLRPACHAFISAHPGFPTAH